MACGRRGRAAAELDFASCVVTACCLRCLDHSMVVTGAEFASPTGAPLGYERGSSIGQVRPGLAEPRSPVERVAQSG